MEASVVAERASREEAEQGLERALSAKGKLERFLEGILRVRKKTRRKGGDKLVCESCNSRRKPSLLSVLLLLLFATMICRFENQKEVRKCSSKQ